MKAKVIETGEIVEVYREPQHGQVSSIFKEAVFFNGRIWNENELDFCIEAEEFPKKIYAYGGEYVRTDAVIENTSEWLCNNYDKYIRVIGGSIYIDYSNLCRDFQNYIKRE